MSKLSKHFAVVVLAVLAGYAVIVTFVVKYPGQSTVEQKHEVASSEIDRYVELLQNTPIHSWTEQSFISDVETDFWIEANSIETFKPEDAERLRAGETLSGSFSNMDASLSRLVPGTDHAITIYFGEVIYEGAYEKRDWIALLTIGTLLLLFALYRFVVVGPLKRQLLGIELAAQSYASGNFAIRAPVEDVAQHHDVTRRFNEMATQIELLISDKNSMLEDYREILRAVAHEFRGPLARLRFALDMTADANGESGKHHLQRMSNDIDGLNLLVSEVISYARLQPGSPGFSFSTIEVEELIDNALSECRLNFPEIEFTAVSDSELPMIVEADSYYMQRAILNLLNNAGQHSRQFVRVSWMTDQYDYTVCVEDDGDGVPPHWRDRIFEPFVRVDRSRSRQSGGVGLGLAIAKRIAENHHGGINVDKAKELGGARFCLTWPVGMTDC